MKKILIEEPFRIKVVETSYPGLECDSALIETAYIGICGSDVLKYTGKYKNLTYPVTPGHEFTGVIKKIRENKLGLKIGDGVVVNPNISCGKCQYCLKNKSYLCENLKTLGANGIDGAMQSLINVPLKNIHKIDKKNLKVLALSEPLSVAIHPILSLNTEDQMLFFGLGGIGTLSLIYFKERIKNISIVEISKIQLEAASSFGVNGIFEYKFLINNYKKFYKKFDDIIINCPLSQEIFDISKALVKKGGRIIIIGLSLEDIKIDFVDTLNKEISIITSFKFSEEDFYKAVNFLEAKNVSNLLKIKTFPIENASDAFEFKIENPEYKTLLKNVED